MIRDRFPGQIWGVYSYTAPTLPNIRLEGSYSTALGVWTHPIDPELAYMVTFGERVFTYAEFLSMVISMRTITRKHARKHPGFT
jgi:hypothetical protein